MNMVKAKRFPKDARVVFIGDSITCGNLYVSRIVSYYRDNFPEDNINFYNCGASGGASRDMLRLLDFETLGYEPTHAVLMFGVNDSGRSELAKGRSAELYQELYRRYENFKKNFDEICKRLHEKDIDITLATPVPLDEYSKFDTDTYHGSFALVAAYAEFVRAYAKENGYPLIDQFAYFTKLLATGEDVYNTDRTHPNEYGQYHLAKNILESQGLKAPDFAPIPEYLDRWRELLTRYRYYVITVETLLVGRYDLPPEESIAIVQKKLATETNEFILRIGGEYVKTKPEAAKLKAEIIKEMEVELKK